MKSLNTDSLKKYLLRGIVLGIIVVVVFAVYQRNSTPVVFQGTTPCADCPGIVETITLFPNHTYTDRSVYLERNVQNTTGGNWSIVQSSKYPGQTIYKLQNQNGQQISYYLLEKNQVRPLTSDLGEIPPPYNAPLARQ